MIKADQIGVYGRVLPTVWEQVKKKKKLEFNLLSIASAADYPPSAEWYEDIMWNCLHDYPIKTLIHNLKQLKGGDCYSVSLTRFSVDWRGLPSLLFDLSWTSLIRPAGLVVYLETNLGDKLDTDHRFKGFNEGTKPPRMINIGWVFLNVGIFQLELKLNLWYIVYYMKWYKYEYYIVIVSV